MVCEPWEAPLDGDKVDLSLRVKQKVKLVTLVEGNLKGSLFNSYNTLILTLNI